MDRVVARPIKLKDAYTFNQLKRMSTAQSSQVDRFIRTKACESWKRGDHVGILDEPVEFHLYFFVYPELAKVPDTDSIAWYAKAILDGAQDAGLIRDDSPDAVSRQVLWGARYTILPSPHRYAYVGVLKKSMAMGPLGDDYVIR